MSAYDGSGASGIIHPAFAPLLGARDTLDFMILTFVQTLAPRCISLIESRPPCNSTRIRRPSIIRS
jgi:hypothetical protein